MTGISTNVALLDPSDSEEIYKTSLEILNTVGMRIDDDRFLSALEDRGARVDYPSRIVKFPERLLRETTRTIHSRNSASSDSTGKSDNPKPRYHWGGGPVLYRLDYDHGQIRKGTVQDALEVIRLADALDEIAGLCSTMLVYSRDLDGAPFDPKLYTLKSVALTAKNTSKITYAENIHHVRELEYLIELCRIVKADSAPSVGASSASLGTQATGQLALLAPSSGELEFAFSRQGEADRSGGQRFLLQLPRALATVIELDLPLDLTPLADRGVVTAQGAAGEGLRRWRIELGIASEVTLRVARLEVLAERERLVLVRQTLNYDLSATGLELGAEFDLDVHHQPLKRVEFVVEPGLQLAAARYGETPLDWSVVRGDESGSRVVIELPDPVLGEGRKLRLSARGELVRGTAWRLPALRPNGLFWQEGQATIRVLAPLTITQLATNRCRQTGTGW